MKKLFLSQMIRAKRAGSWFRLAPLERTLYSLALKLDIKLQSSVLLKALVSVLKHLRDVYDKKYIAMMEGARLAWEFSDAAVTWGNESARAWRSDVKYIRFLSLLAGER